MGERLRSGEPADARPRCEHCRYAIGDDEPLVIVRPGSDPVRTSLAANPEAADYGWLMHARCHAATQ